MSTVERVEPLIRWPEVDELGRFVVGCSCLRWTFTGTADEIRDAGRRHDDSPRAGHIVTIRGKVTTETRS